LQRRLEVEADQIDVKGVEPTEFSDASLGVLVNQNDARLGFDFYASAPSAQALSDLEPTLQRMLDSARWAGEIESSAPAAGEAQTTGWQIFEGEEYGFQLKIPQGWTYREMETAGPGMPENWPLERVGTFTFDG
jgi:hypothetical protein